MTDQRFTNAVVTLLRAHPAIQKAERGVSVAVINAWLKEVRAAAAAGKFHVEAFHPQPIAVLRQATDEQLLARKVQNGGAASRKWEDLNIARILKERSEAVAASGIETNEPERMEVAA